MVNHKLPLKNQTESKKRGERFRYNSALPAVCLSGSACSALSWIHSLPLVWVVFLDQNWPNQALFGAWGDWGPSHAPPSPTPFSPQKRNMQLCVRHFPKYSCYATKCTKTARWLPDMPWILARSLCGGPACVCCTVLFSPRVKCLISLTDDFFWQPLIHLLMHTHKHTWPGDWAHTHTHTHTHKLQPGGFMNGLVVKDWLRQHIELRGVNLHSSRWGTLLHQIQHLWAVPASFLPAFIRLQDLI